MTFGLLACGLFGWHSRAQTSGVRLSIEVLPIQGVRLSWTTDAGGVVLQRANSLTAPLIWNPAPGTPTQQNNRFTMSFDTSGNDGLTYGSPLLVPLVGGSGGGGVDAIPNVTEGRG